MAEDQSKGVTQSVQRTATPDQGPEVLATSATSGSTTHAGVPGQPVGVLIYPLPQWGVEFDLARKGIDWALVAWKIDNTLREWLKHGCSHKAVDSALEALREELHDEMEVQGVSFDMIP